MATTYNNLAGFYLEQGKLDDAYKIFKKLDAADGLARYHLVKKDYKKAEKEYLRSLRYAEAELCSQSFSSPIISGLELTFEGQRNCIKARESFRKAIEIIEKQWQNLASFGQEGVYHRRSG